MSSNACSNSEATHWHGGLQGAGGCGGWWRSGRLDKPPQPPPASSSLNIRLIPWSTIRSVMPQAEPVAAVPTDAALVAAWQGGDEQAAAELVRRHARALARFLSGAGALEADLDDLVQETFIRASRAVPLGEDVRATDGDPHERAVAGEAEGRLRQGLERLSRMQREVFLLRAQQGLDYEEIAAALETSPGAARVHYHHAVKRLKEYLS